MKKITSKSVFPCSLLRGRRFVSLAYRGSRAHAGPTLRWGFHLAADLMLFLQNWFSFYGMNDNWEKGAGELAMGVARLL